MTFGEVRTVSVGTSIPKDLYDKFKAKIKIDGFTVTEAVESLIYNYVNDIYKR